MVRCAGKVGELTKLINNLEFQFKEQNSEIDRLRHTNAEILKANSNLTERVARLEEARNTMAVQMAAFLEKQETNAKIDKMLEAMEDLKAENEALKREQVSKYNAPKGGDIKASEAEIAKR